MEETLIDETSVTAEQTATFGASPHNNPLTFIVEDSVGGKTFTLEHKRASDGTFDVIHTESLTAGTPVMLVVEGPLRQGQVKVSSGSSGNVYVAIIKSAK